MLYSQDVISEVKTLNDIVDIVASYGVRLEPRSGEHVGLCPFHNEKTASFSVNRDKQMFFCHGCGAGGNVLGFVRRMENLDFADALKLLAERVHFNLPEKTSTREEKERAAAQASERKLCEEINKLVARFFYDNLYEESGAATREYLENRGVKPELMRKFGLGLSRDEWSGLATNFPEISLHKFETAGLVKKGQKSSGYYDRFRGRLMFPIIDTRGRVIGFGGRTMKEDTKEAKYLNSPETALFKKSECLYGLNLAKKARKDEIIVVEGYMDVVAMHMYGFTNTVGVLGTAMRNTHARLIKNSGAKTVILILDSDEAGMRAAQRAIPVLIKENLKLKILEIPDAKDPDEYLSKFGASKFATLLANAKTYLGFQLDVEKRKHDLESAKGKENYAKAAVNILKPIESNIETENYALEVSRDTGFSLSAILSDINKKRGEPERIFVSMATVRTKNDSGLKNFKNCLLHIVLTSKSAARALEKSECLSPDEIGGESYKKLLEFAFEHAKNTQILSPNDIMDFFESDEVHQILAEIFINPTKYTSEAAMEKDLNVIAKKLKESWLLSQILAKKNDTIAAKSLESQRKSINSLNISLRDG
ncbi:MAG: DNA primase [Defluviitaleaceae bacterium]|nr:DNA primase [Defluviitaleaceae bacterium]